MGKNLPAPGEPDIVIDSFLDCRSERLRAGSFQLGITHQVVAYNIEKGNDVPHVLMQDLTTHEMVRYELPDIFVFLLKDCAVTLAKQMLDEILHNAVMEGKRGGFCVDSFMKESEVMVKPDEDINYKEEGSFVIDREKYLKLSNKRFISDEEWRGIDWKYLTNKELFALLNRSLDTIEKRRRNYGDRYCPSSVSD